MQGFVRSTTKYWVRTTDVSAVKNHVLQHLPVFQFEKTVGGRCLCHLWLAARQSHKKTYCNQLARSPTLQQHSNRYSSRNNEQLESGQTG